MENYGINLPDYSFNLVAVRWERYSFYSREFQRKLREKKPIKPLGTEKKLTEAKMAQGQFSTRFLLAINSLASHVSEKRKNNNFINKKRFIKINYFIKCLLLFIK